MILGDTFTGVLVVVEVGLYLVSSRFRFYMVTHQTALSIMFDVSISIVVVALTFFRSLYIFRLTFLRMRDKCKIMNVQQHYKAFFL